MDSKQAPPPYSEVASAPPTGTQNEGYVPTAGDQGGTSGTGSYPPQTGYNPGYNYPQGYAQPAGHYGQPLPAPGYTPQQGYPMTGGYTYQQAVVMTQPVSQGMAVTSVPDHMGLAIFTTLCCCWPLGLVAIMRAQESRRALERGDFSAASTYSAEARRYSMWAIAGGCISIVITIVIIVVWVSASSTYY